jgi:hypothetical protein
MESQTNENFIDTRQFVFPIVIILAVILAFMVKGFVLGGMMMGIMSTIGVWVLVLKCPSFLKQWMGKHVLLSDLMLSTASYSIMAAMGPGPTLFMAAATQAVLLSILIPTLDIPPHD